MIGEVYLDIVFRINKKALPMATRSKAWVCSQSLAGIAGPNPAGGVDVCLLWVLSIAR
jgi:hypothetical protein